MDFSQDKKMLLPCPTQENNYLNNHIQLLHNSLHALTGQNLIQKNESPTKAAQRIFHAPFALLSHNNASDPILTYGNRTALELFEMNWEELIATPSRYTAESANQEKRKELLDQVTEHGFIGGYSGIRISKNKQRFQIKDTIIWNLTDEQGSFSGQAAMFEHWTFL